MSMTHAALDLNLPSDGRPRLAPLDAWKQSLDSTAQAYAREVQEAVRSLMGAVAAFEGGWQLICQETLAGKTTEMHATRARFLGGFNERLRELREAVELLHYAERISARELPETKQVQAEIDALQKKLTRLSTRWQTSEDLEDLAAESIPISTEKIDAIRQKYGYPQAWYDEESLSMP